MITLFGTDAEFQQFLSVNTGFRVENLKNQYNEALTNYIFPYCSKEQFDASVLSADPKDAELIRLIKFSAANLGMYLYFPLAKVQISNGGIQWNVDKTKQASAEDKEDLAASMKRTGLAGVESILAYLEANEDHFATWKASNSYTKYVSLLIRTAPEFKIIDDSRQVFLKLIPYIEDVEFDIIKGAVPAVVLDKLYSRDFGTDVDVKAVFETLLEKYVQVVVRCFALAQAINAFAVVKDQYNTLTVYDDTGAGKMKGYKDAPVNKLDKWRADLEKLGAKRLELMNAFLIENAEDLGFEVAAKVSKTIAYKNDVRHGTAFF